MPLAERLARELRHLLGQEIEVGAVDITLYRDDLGQGGALARAARHRDPVRRRRGRGGAGG